MGMGQKTPWGQRAWGHGDGCGDRHGMEGLGTWGWGAWGCGDGAWGEHGDRRRGIVGMEGLGTGMGKGGMGRGGWGQKRAWGQIAWGRGAKAHPEDRLWGTVGTKHGGQAMGPGPQAGGDTNFATTPHPVTSSARPDASLHPPRGGPCPLPYKSGTVTALGAAHAGPSGGIGARKGDGAFGAFTLEPTDGRRCSHVLRAQRGRQVSGGAGRPRHLPRPGAESHLAAAAALSSVSPQRGPRAASCGAAPRTASGAAAGGGDDGGGRWGRGAERVRRGPRHGGLV